jgi:2-dehydro-3-deoxygluconokinase
MMPEIVTLGEAMLRLSPPGTARFEQVTQLDVVVGGSEQSVAVGLARLGRDVAFVTKLPKNPLGRLIYSRTREQGVDVRYVAWGEERAGLYFYEQGLAPRPSQVIYDRSRSAACALQAKDVDWAAALAGCRLFHTSGITAALSASCLTTVEHALVRARKLGIPTSFDLNYRSRLWDEATAAKVYRRLLPRCTVLFASAPALATFFDLTGSPQEAAQACRAEFGCAVVVLTDRTEEGGLRGSMRALAVGEQTAESASLDFDIVDRLGAGDAFAAGFLDGYLGGDLQRAVNQGTAMAAFKHTIPGEFCLIDRAELDGFLAHGTRQVVR